MPIKRRSRRRSKSRSLRKRRRSKRRRRRSRSAGKRRRSRKSRSPRRKRRRRRRVQRGGAKCPNPKECWILGEDEKFANRIEAYDPYYGFFYGIEWDSDLKKADIKKAQAKASLKAHEGCVRHRIDTEWPVVDGEESPMNTELKEILNAAVA